MPEFDTQFLSMDSFESKPLKGVRVGLIRETLEEGVDSGVRSATQEAASHLEALGCVVTEVCSSDFLLFNVFFVYKYIEIYVFKFHRSLFLHSLLDYQLTM